MGRMPAPLYDVQGSTMTWPQIISIVTNSVTAGAVVIGVYVANKGINAWRRETLGKRKIQLSEQAIPVFTRARAVIKEARSPYMAAEEVVEVYRAFGGTVESADRDKLGKIAHQYYAAIHRLQKHRDVFIEMDSLRPLFTAYFGDDTDIWFEAIKQAHIKITVTSDILVRMAEQGQLEHDFETTQGFEAIIWNVEEDDEIGKSVKDAQEAAVARCSDVLAHN